MDSACVQMFRAVSITNDDGIWWHNGDGDVSSTRNLFCYIFLRSDHIFTTQTTKNQNMAGTKLRISQVWNCLNFPGLVWFSGETGYRGTSQESALYPLALHYYWRSPWLQDSGGHHWGFNKRTHITDFREGHGCQPCGCTQLCCVYFVLSTLV